MQYTENYQFRKPVIGVDDADVKDINFNSDRTDTLIHNTQISLAPAYDLNETYDTGDVVMYETLMYKCKADNTTGAWDASKWERTTAGEEGAGGGGSSVVPNPQGEPTDTLETIEIDGTVYDIAGSGGGGGSVSITVDDLWTNDNSYGIGTYALSEDIDEYDFIEIWYGVYSEYVGSPYLSESKVFSVDTLNELYSDNTSLLLTGYSNRAIYCTLHDTTLSITYSDANTVLKVRGIKLSGGGSSGGTSAEIIPITAGDGTTSRTFTLSKTPKKVTMQGYTSGDGGWYESGYFIWGENFISLYGAQGDRATGGYVGQASITYGQDGKSFTITAVNSFGAFNRSDGWVGNMLVDYGEGSGSSGASSDDMSDMTWTLLDSTTGTGTSTLIPTGAKYLVLVVEFSVSASIVAKESIKNIIKTMDITSKSVWNVGYEWCDTAGNHTYVAMSGDATHVQAYSGHNTVTAKVYAVS